MCLLLFLLSLSLPFDSYPSRSFHSLLIFQPSSLRIVNFELHAFRLLLLQQLKYSDLDDWLVLLLYITYLVSYTFHEVPTFPVVKWNPDFRLSYGHQGMSEILLAQVDIRTHKCLSRELLDFSDYHPYSSSR